MALVPPSPAGEVGRIFLEGDEDLSLYAWPRALRAPLAPIRCPQTRTVVRSVADALPMRGLTAACLAPARTTLACLHRKEAELRRWSYRYFAHSTLDDQLPRPPSHREPHLTQAACMFGQRAVGTPAEAIRVVWSHLSVGVAGVWSATFPGICAAKSRTPARALQLHLHNTRLQLHAKHCM